MPESLVISAIAATGLAVAALGILVWSRMRTYRAFSRSSGPEQEYSSERLAPLMRLLGSSDADFLRSHVHCPQVAAEWERSKRRIVRLYLRELSADFQQLHQKARALVARSPEQYADLVPVLFKQQIVFWRRMAWIELRLTMGFAGLPKIDAERLLAALEAMRREVAQASAAA